MTRSRSGGSSPVWAERAEGLGQQRHHLVGRPPRAGADGVQAERRRASPAASPGRRPSRAGCVPPGQFGGPQVGPAGVLALARPPTCLRQLEQGLDLAGRRRLCRSRRRPGVPTAVERPASQWCTASS